jgi:nucleoside-diphosphate-sugar epimerase
MKVLFVGATGLIGSHVIPFLKEKFDITPAAFDEGVVADLPVIKMDIRHWEATEVILRNGAAGGEQFDAVVYCATANYRENGLQDKEELRRYYENCIEVNVRGSYHVFEAAYRAGVPRVIHIGSMTAMLGQPHHEKIDSEAHDRPADLYAASKIFGEHVGRSYAFRVANPNVSMQVLCLRLGQPFISRDHWRQIPHARKGLQLAVCMEDIAHAIECALLTEVRYGVYPVVSKVEDSWVDPVMYAELGYEPRWKFTADETMESLVSKRKL